MTTKKKFTIDHSRLTILDAPQSIFFARELERIIPTQFMAKYPDLEAELLLPTREMADPADDKITWALFDENGSAIPMAGNEDGGPTVDVTGAQLSALLQSWKSGYKYSVEEIEKARKVGRPLEQMRANAARRQIALALNSMALLGDAVAGVTPGIKGLFNQPNALTTALVADGTGSTTTWSTKTADQVLRDLFQIADAMPNNTLDIEGGDGRQMRMLMPKNLRRLLTTLRLGTSAQDTSVLGYFQRERPNVQIIGANYLATAGAGATRRIVFYDPAQVIWAGALPFDVMPPEQKGWGYVINCRGKGGGVFTPYPRSILYADGA